MKILITGGAGFIGSNLALRLVDRGHEVVAMDCLSTQVHGSDPQNTSPLYRSIKDKVKVIKGDVCVKEDWEKVLPDIDVLVHLASETGTGQSMYEIRRYTNVNANGTALMLDLLTNNRNFDVKKIVVASSRAVYGEGKYYSEEFGVVYPGTRTSVDMSNGDFEVKYKNNKSPLQSLPTSEDSNLHPSSVYGITKLSQEQLAICVCKSLNLDCVVFRYQNVFGPGQSLHNPYTGILSIFSTLIKSGQPVNVFEDGKETRDFVFIDDAVNATLLGIEKEEANGQIFNVGSGTATTVVTIASTLINKYGIDVPINITGDFRIGDIRHNYADLAKIEHLLGYRPAVNFENGISAFVGWVNKQNIIKSSFEESYNEMKLKGLLK